MHDPIKTIQSLGLDAANPVFLVQAVKEFHPYTGWSKEQFDAACTQVLFGDKPTEDQVIVTDSFTHAKYYFLYVCQTFINLDRKFIVADSDEVRRFAFSDCATFMLNNKVALELEDGSSTDTSSDGVNRRSGTKTEICNNMYIEYSALEDGRERFIQECISDLDMSRSGALTYYHAARKRNND